MFSDKLLTLLQSFSKYELNRFRKFLQSPYFNEQENLLQLFDLCNQSIRKGEAEVIALDKNKVWRQLFPGRRLDDPQLRRMSSELTHLGLKFYAIEYQENYPVGALLNLQKKLETSDLPKHLTAVERQLSRHFEQEKKQSAAHYLDQFIYYWNISERTSRSAPDAEFISYLLTADFHLESFYLLQKLKLYVAWLSYRNFRQTTESIELVEGFWKYIDSGRFKSDPLIQIYRHMAICLAEPDEQAHFQRLMIELETKADILGKEDLFECYKLAQNYCALKINQGETHYYSPSFKIYREMIKRDMLLADGQISEAAYKNVITISLLAGEYAWVEQFIQQYANFLPPGIRENARSYNLAYLNFHQGKHDQVIELLRSVEYSDITYAVGAKLMLLRTYYETGEILALDSLIDSVRIYLRRNRLISKVMSKEFGNFLNFLKKLTTLNVSSPTEIAQFRQKVLDNPAVISKKWLLEKIDEL